MIRHTRSASKTLADDYRARKAAIMRQRERNSALSAGAFARATATTNGKATR